MAAWLLAAGCWLLVDSKAEYVAGASNEWESRHGDQADGKTPVEPDHLDY